MATGIERTERSGNLGAWGVTHFGERVLLKFTSSDGEGGENLFQAELTAEVAVRMAESLISHARRAGFRETVTMTIGG